MSGRCNRAKVRDIRKRRGCRIDAERRGGRSSNVARTVGNRRGQNLAAALRDRRQVCRRQGVRPGTRAICRRCTKRRATKLDGHSGVELVGRTNNRVVTRNTADNSIAATNRCNPDHRRHFIEVGHRQGDHLLAGVARRISGDDREAVAALDLVVRARSQADRTRARVDRKGCVVAV